MQDQKNHYNNPFIKLVQGKVQTMTAMDGQIYFSADDFCELLDRMAVSAGKLMQSAPHPAAALQVNTIKNTLRSVSDAVRTKQNCEKSKQPSAN